MSAAGSGFEELNRFIFASKLVMHHVIQEPEVTLELW
jgi:hypothetical protein